jgi:hypothetical protein
LRDGEAIVFERDVAVFVLYFHFSDGFDENFPTDKVEPTGLFINKFVETFAPDGIAEFGLRICPDIEIFGVGGVGAVEEGTVPDLIKQGEGFLSMSKFVERFGLDKEYIGVTKNGTVVVSGEGGGSDVIHVYVLPVTG